MMIIRSDYDVITIITNCTRYIKSWYLCHHDKRAPDHDVNATTTDFSTLCRELISIIIQG